MGGSEEAGRCRTRVVGTRTSSHENDTQERRPDQKTKRVTSTRENPFGDLPEATLAAVAAWIFTVRSNESSRNIRPPCGHFRALFCSCRLRALSLGIATRVTKRVSLFRLVRHLGAARASAKQSKLSAARCVSARACVNRRPGT